MLRSQRLYLLVLALVLPLAPGARAQSLQFDGDVSPALRKQIEADLAWMSQVEGSEATPIHQQTFGPIHGGGYAQWFHGRVFYFGVDSCGGASAVACVKAKYNNKMFVTGNFINAKVPQAARLMTLFHEARHTEKENGMWSHARCPSNFPYRSIWTNARLRNKTACDNTAYGSYASAAVLFNNISRFCTNCTDKIKADARLYSDEQGKRVIGAAAGLIAADFGYKP